MPIHARSVVAIQARCVRVTIGCDPRMFWKDLDSSVTCTGTVQNNLWVFRFEENQFLVKMNEEGKGKELLEGKMWMTCYNTNLSVTLQSWEGPKLESPTGTVWVRTMSTKWIDEHQARSNRARLG